MQEPLDAHRTGSMRLDGKVALVTGGTKNIGLATARAFAAAGADLVITARGAAGLAKAREELETLGRRRVVTIQADVSEDEAIVRSVDAALEAFGGVDVLVNNAYYAGRLAGRHPGVEMTAEHWEAIWRGNVLAPYRYIQLLEPAMRARGAGSIINLVSIAASGYVHGLMGYAASKSALATMTRYLAVDLGPAIRVNAISPGAVSPDGNPLGGIQRELSGRSALQRVGRADEVASLALFLASDTSSYVTGQTLVADGGVLARAFAPCVMAQPR